VVTPIPEVSPDVIAAEIIEPTVETLPDPLIVSPVITPETIEDKIARYASIYGLNKEHFNKVILCESHASTTIQSQWINSNGERERSFGIAQIHLPDHPDVSLEEALDADFSLNWMANEWSIGKARQWTCWRNLYGN
jgi:hypothetical protein